MAASEAQFTTLHGDKKQFQVQLHEVDDPASGRCEWVMAMWRVGNPDRRVEDPLAVLLAEMAEEQSEEQRAERKVWSSEAIKHFHWNSTQFRLECAYKGWGWAVNRAIGRAKVESGKAAAVASATSSRYADL
jgi:hypothetical protein